MKEPTCMEEEFGSRQEQQDVQERESMTAPLDLDGLEKLCKEATPGERIQYGTEVTTRTAELRVKCFGVALNNMLSKNAAFIAAANPVTVLALIQEVRTARERLGPAGYKILQEVTSLREKLKMAEEALDRLCIHNGGCDGPLGCGCAAPFAIKALAKIRGQG